MLRRLEQLFGVGDAVTEVFGASRQSKKVTARNITPFLLQDDDVIINKTVLLRGAQDERRLSIIDTFPYFLGVVDETAIARQELRRLRTQYAAEERRIISIDRTGTQLRFVSEPLLLKRSRSVCFRDLLMMRALNLYARL